MTCPKMIYVALPGEEPRAATFYLAAEEYIARHADVGEAFLTWQVGPTVVFGRNQAVRREVDLDYCRREAIDVCRRKSGGGCIYADRGNVMFSHIGRGENVAELFARYLDRTVGLLRALGVRAEATGRNDITVDGRKVSGAAFYQLPGHSVVHGTMLYDTDMRHMTRALTPPDCKLQAKGVESVRQRIALLKDYLDVTLATFVAQARDHLCADTLTLTPADVAAIRRIEATYRDPAFVFGADPAYSLARSRRVEGCGTVEIRVDVRHGRIRDVALGGDFFGLADPASLLAALRDVPFTPAAVRAVLVPLQPERYVRHLAADDLVALLFDNEQSSADN